MPEFNDLKDLSPSTVTALRFAHASAAVRRGDGPAEIDALDIMLGIMLAHPGTSPAQRCCEHFRFTVGDIKPGDRLTANTAELNEALREIGSGWLPVLDSEAFRVLESARSQRGSDNVVHLRHLWGGLIGLQTGAFPDLLRPVLLQRGVSLDQLVDVTNAWLRSDEQKSERQYSTVLASELPYRSQPVALAKYNSESGVTTGDLLQLSAEVDAFAYLLASKDLSPPLAIGLFGDWGSGKSFFMESVKDRVRAVLDDPSVADVAQADTPFWKRVVQIDFNAWHYSEGDLLASLVNHLFTELERQTAGRSSDHAIEHLDTWLNRLTQVTKQEEAAHEAVHDKQAAVVTIETELTKAETQAEKALAEIDQKVLKSSAQHVKDAINPVLESVQLGSGATVADAQRELARAKHEVTRTRALTRSFWDTPWRRALSTAMIAFVPILVLIVNEVQGAAESAVAGLAAAGGQAVAALMTANAWITRRNDSLELAAARVEEELRRATEDARRAADSKRAELVEAQHALATAKQDAAKLVAKRTDIEQRISEPTYQVIQQFIHERLAAGTYQKRLGLHAIVREDLKRLADFVREQNRLEYGNKRRDSIGPTDATGELGGDASTRMFNRVILYIDDLDRCDDDKVIAVLQAVHLLLAFELFVVVVAVDDRWLSHALETEYPVLARRRFGHNGAAGSIAAPPQSEDSPGPSDYLEKIFQIPFRVRPIGDDGRRRMIDGLLKGQVRATASGDGRAEAAQGVRLVTQREEEVLTSLVHCWSRDISTAAEGLTLTLDEFDMLRHLAPMLGNTPRAVKRFVNLYQLLKMMTRSPTSTDPPDYQVAALLLGLDEGRPDLAAKLRNLGTSSLGAMIPELSAITDMPGSWGSVTADRIGAVSDLVARLQFPSAGTSHHPPTGLRPSP